MWASGVSDFTHASKTEVWNCATTVDARKSVSSISMVGRLTMTSMPDDISIRAIVESVYHCQYLDGKESNIDIYTRRYQR
jgi:hypothetical protein